jgi:hypothetical protein
MTTPSGISPRSSALHLCYWLYEDQTEAYRVEFTYWATSSENINGGVEIDTQILAWVKRPSKTDQSWDTECSWYLPDIASALAHLASGIDPLRESFSTDKATMTKLKEKVPEFAAFYDNLALGAVAAKPPPSVSGPNRL